MACGTSSSDRVRSGLRSWRHRTERWLLRTPTASTRAPKSSNVIDGEEGTGRRSHSSSMLRQRGAHRAMNATKSRERIVGEPVCRSGI
jgi:hypothetical protein